MIFTLANRLFAETFELLDFYFPDFEIPGNLDLCKFGWQKFGFPQFQTHMDMYLAFFLFLVHSHTDADRKSSKKFL